MKVSNFSHIKRFLLETAALGVGLYIPLIIKGLIDTAYTMQDVQLALLLTVLMSGFWAMRLVALFYAKELLKIAYIQQTIKHRQLAMEKIIHMLMAMAGAGIFAFNWASNSLGVIAALSIYAVIILQHAQYAIQAILEINHPTARLKFNFPYMMETTPVHSHSMKGEK